MRVYNTTYRAHKMSEGKNVISSTNLFQLRKCRYFIKIQNAEFLVCRRLVGLSIEVGTRKPSSPQQHVCKLYICKVYRAFYPPPPFPHVTAHGKGMPPPHPLYIHFSPLSLRNVCQNKYVSVTLSTVQEFLNHIQGVPQKMSFSDFLALTDVFLGF